MVKRKKTHPSRILQLRVSIRGMSPPVWRKLLINSDTTLHELHLMIQAAMGWYNCHLYEFSYGQDKYSNLDHWDEIPEEEIDSTQVTLGDLDLSEGDELTYLYDFGDNWEHTVSVQKILAQDTSYRLPACIGGKRNCPPEDCGGVYGYYDVLKTAGDPQDPEHDEMVEWLGEYNPEEFDMQLADSRVKNYKEMEQPV